MTATRAQSSHEPQLPSISLSPLTLNVDLADNISRLENLIKEFKIQHEKKGKEAVSTKMLASQILLAFVGAFAGFLYLDPAKSCAADASTAQTTCDDTWLIKQIPPEIIRHYLYFLSGFIGFASTNATFSYDGPPSYMDMLNSLNSPLKKVLASGGVVSFMLMQGVQIYLAAKGAGSEPLSMTMTVTGSLPGSIFGGVGLIKNSPQLVSQAKNQVKHFYYDCCFTHLSQEKRTEMAIEAFYDYQRKQFNALILANWKSVVANIDKLDITGNEAPLGFLLGQQAEPKTESRFGNSLRKALQVLTGGTLTAAFSAPIVDNTYKSLADMIPQPDWRLPATVALSAPILYGNVALVKKAVNNTIDALTSKLHGERVDSLVFQLRHKSTLALGAMSMATAFFSYAVIDRLFQNMWAPTNPGTWSFDPQSVARGVARAGIGVYHTMGPLDVGTQILFRRILSNGTSKEKFLAKLQLLVTHLTEEMSQADFIRRISNEVNQEDRKQLRVALWGEFTDEMRQAMQEESLTQINKMGLAKFAKEILGLTVSRENTPTSSPSPTSSHWQSSRYTFAAGSRSSSSSILDHENSLLDPFLRMGKKG